MNSNPLSDLSSLHLSRRGVLGMGAALGVGAAVSACGGGSSGGPGAGAAANVAEGPYEGEKVTLGFWNGFTGGDGAYMKQMVETFNSEHENIEVQMNVLEWADFYSKVPNAVASGAGPDVAAMHVDQVGTNAARRVIMSLDEFTGPMDLNEEDFDATVWNAGMYDGQRYAIPLDVHPLGFYYNNTLLQKGGITEPPKDRESWEAALTGMKSNGVQYPFWATATWPAHIIFVSLINQFGGSLFNEDATEATFASDEGVEALEWYASHVEEGFSPPNVANDAQAQAFRQGRDAMTWDGIWMMNEWAKVQGLDWGASPLPTIGDKPAVWASSHQLVVMQQREVDENKLHAARDFLGYLSANSIEWAKSGQIPARNSVRESDEFAALEVQSTLAEQLEHAVYFPTIPGIGDIHAPTYEQAVNTVVLGKSDARTALEDAEKKANALLEDNRQKYSA
jgi:multiple sugar transport system substrate-binding protein